jgi:hypothetical protein
MKNEKPIATFKDLDLKHKVKYETVSKTDKEEKFDILNYSSSLNEQINYIKDKIKAAEIKITALLSKESIINKMIERTNSLVEKYHEENNLKLAGINSSYILTQFETFAQVQEMLIKYEDMIQKYIKMSIDVENHKLNAYVKLNNSKEAQSNEEGYEKLMGKIHEMMTDTPEQAQSNSVLLESVKEQLKLEGY